MIRRLLPLFLLLGITTTHAQLIFTLPSFGSDENPRTILVEALHEGTVADSRSGTISDSDPVILLGVNFGPVLVRTIFENNKQLLPPSEGSYQESHFTVLFGNLVSTEPETLAAGSTLRISNIFSSSGEPFEALWVLDHSGYRRDAQGNVLGSGDIISYLTVDFDAPAGELLIEVAHDLTIPAGEQLSFTATFNLSLRDPGPAIPEPSTYAAIFGALALGLVILRRRHTC